MLPLLEQLTLTKVDDTHFVGPPSRESHIRSYGGQLIAQALLAAQMTISDNRMCHSMHAYFPRPGSTTDESQLSVDVVRDGRSFSLRDVTTTQNDKDVFRMMASFHTGASGPEHQTTMPDAPSPETLATFRERFAGRESYDDAGRWFDRLESFDMRFVGPTPMDEEALPGRSQFWVRVLPTLPADAVMHQAALMYVSDMFLHDPIWLVHGLGWTSGKIVGTSLDHAAWFHHDFDITQWLLVDQTSSVSAHTRGVSRAEVWTPDGRLVSTITQEVLLRPPRSAAQ